MGKPNAGKSTLLSRVSRARPEIADYPFTTKIPNLGIVQVDIDHAMVMADIPGLIEGAHSGAGLGHEFLRHVERTRVLVHLVEPEPMDGTDPIENYRAIRAEVEKYDIDLAGRPEIVAVSKAELPGAEASPQRVGTGNRQTCVAILLSHRPGAQRTDPQSVLPVKRTAASNMSELPDLLAVDVGTSRVKFGWFPGDVTCATQPPTSLLPIAAPQLPEPAETFACQHRGVPVSELIDEVAAWLSQFDELRPQVAMASVNHSAARAVETLFSQIGYPKVQVLTGSDLPLVVKVKEPGRVGIDRLLNAVAVNRIRQADLPAVVMDLGTAVTVDLVGNKGEFLGGAILPGWSLSAAALHGAASTLPLLTPDNMQLPEKGLGKCTSEAMASGLTWGLVGALEQLIAMYSGISAGKPQLFLTGGDATLVVDALNESVGPVRHVSHLVLAGIALASEATR